MGGGRRARWAVGGNFERLFICQNKQQTYNYPGQILANNYEFRSRIICYKMSLSGARCHKFMDNKKYYIMLSLSEVINNDEGT